MAMGLSRQPILGQSQGTGRGSVGTYFDSERSPAAVAPSSGRLAHGGRTKPTFSMQSVIKGVMTTQLVSKMFLLATGEGKEERGSPSSAGQRSGELPLAATSTGSRRTSTRRNRADVLLAKGKSGNVNAGSPLAKFRRRFSSASNAELPLGLQRARSEEASVSLGAGSRGSGAGKLDEAGAESTPARFQRSSIVRGQVNGPARGQRGDRALESMDSLAVKKQISTMLSSQSSNAMTAKFASTQSLNIYAVNEALDDMNKALETEASKFSEEAEKTDLRRRQKNVLRRRIRLTEKSLPLQGAFVLLLVPYILYGASFLHVFSLRSSCFCLPSLPLSLPLSLPVSLPLSLPLSIFLSLPTSLPLPLSLFRSPFPAQLNPQPSSPRRNGKERCLDANLARDFDFANCGCGGGGHDIPLQQASNSPHANQRRVLPQPEHAPGALLPCGRITLDQHGTRHHLCVCLLSQPFRCYALDCSPTHTPLLTECSRSNDFGPVLVPCRA